MNSFPKITIITPTFNAEKHIASCIQSVARQTYGDMEHLIIDGASTDSTIEVVTQLAKANNHIRFISEKDNGIYDAMNKGIDLATGEWIYFLGADDVFYNDAILESVLTVDIISRFDVVYGNVLWGDTGSIYDGKFSLFKLMNKNICHQAIFYKYDLFDKVGNFDSSYKVWADWLLNIKCFNNDDIRIKYVHSIIAKFALGGHSYRNDMDFDFIRDKQVLFTRYFPPEYVRINENLNRLEVEITQKKQQLAERDTQIQDLTTRLDRLLDSLSWRVTRPVRTLVDFFSNFMK